MTTSANGWAVAEGGRLGLSIAVAPDGVVVVDAELRIVAVHAAGPLGRVGPDAVGSLLRTADPDVHEVISAAVGRVLRTGNAEVGVEVIGPAGGQVVSLFPAGGPAPKTVSCVFGAAAPAGADAFAATTVVAASPDAIVATDLRGHHPELEPRCRAPLRL